jgi:hypothetical protein
MSEQAPFTRELRRRLREDGEVTIVLDEMPDPPFRGRFRTDAEYTALLVSRAQQRIRWAAFYERLRVSCQTRGDRVLGVVTGPVPGYES